MTDMQEREYTADTLATMTVQGIKDELLMLAKGVNLGNAKLAARKILELEEAWEELTGSAFRYAPDPEPRSRPTAPAKPPASRAPAPKAASTTKPKVTAARRTARGGTVQTLKVGTKVVKRKAGITNVPMNTPDNPDAPYGVKLDGTPAKRRGRPKLSTAMDNTAARAAVKTTAKPPAAKPKAPSPATRAAARTANQRVTNPAVTVRRLPDRAPPAATFKEPQAPATVRPSRRKSA